MREIGMSTRAIATATSLGKGTVQREIESGGPNGAPDVQPVTGIDGKTYQPKPPVTDLISDTGLTELNAAVADAPGAIPGRLGRGRFPAG